MTPPPLGYTTRMTVTDVTDGDTLTCETRTAWRVRLRDCWAPEIRGGEEAEKRHGLAAKEFLKSLALGRSGKLYIPSEFASQLGDITSLSRLVGDVWIDGREESLAEAMVKSGFASRRKHGKPGT